MIKSTNAKRLEVTSNSRLNNLKLAEKVKSKELKKKELPMKSIKCLNCGNTWARYTQNGNIYCSQCRNLIKGIKK